MAVRGGLIALTQHPGFLRLWVADGVSNFGTFIFTLALQFLMIDMLAADQFEIGLVRSAQWLPSLLFGLVAGVMVDRIRRKPLLVWTDLTSAVLLLLTVVLALAGLLNIPLLFLLVFLLGIAAVLQGGAHQSFVADLLPTHLLTQGNVRLSQTWTAAQTLGPLLGGVLIRLLGAPAAIVVNAVSYAASALLLWRVPDVDGARPRARTSIFNDLREGIGWVYRHTTLAPYALTLHLWFIGNSIAGTVYVFHANALGLDSTAIGLTLACAGVTGIVGAGLAERAARWFGPGPVVAIADFFTGLAWVIAALAPAEGLTLLALCLAQLSYGFGLGIRGPLEGSYRNAVTPQPLRGRMNTTIRSINYGLIAVAAPFGGWLAVQFGNASALVVAGLIMMISGTLLALSPYRKAVMPEERAARTTD